MPSMFGKLLLVAALLTAPVAAQADDTTPFKVILGFDFHTLSSDVPGPVGPDFRDYNFITSASMSVGSVGGSFGGCPAFQPQYYKQDNISLQFALASAMDRVRLTFTEGSNHNFGGDQEYRVVVQLDGTAISNRLDNPDHAYGYYKINLPAMTAGIHTITWSLYPVNGTISAPGDYFSVCFPALSTY